MHKKPFPRSVREKYLNRKLLLPMKFTKKPISWLKAQLLLTSFLPPWPLCTFSTTSFCWILHLIFPHIDLHLVSSLGGQLVIMLDSHFHFPISLALPRTSLDNNTRYWPRLYGTCHKWQANTLPIAIQGSFKLSYHCILDHTFNRLTLFYTIFPYIFLALLRCNWPMGIVYL